MIRPCSIHDSTLFESCFCPVRLMIRPCLTHDSTLLDSWFDPVWPMIRPCSTHNSTLLDSWFDPVRPMIRHCLTHDSTLIDSCFDPVWLMIPPCSTYDSTLFDPWFDLVRVMIRLCSIHDLTLFDSWFDSWFDAVRPMIRPCLTHDSTLSQFLKSENGIAHTEQKLFMYFDERLLLKFSSTIEILLWEKLCIYPATSYELQYISVTRGFTRSSMKTKYDFRGLISPYVNFHYNRTMWSINLHVKICRWGGPTKNSRKLEQKFLNFVYYFVN